MALLLPFGGMFMDRKQGYPYIDYFRIVAALLVVAIHIYPFSNIFEPLDFFVTRVVGRIAVPFFFVITGYFFYKTPYSIDKLKRNILNIGKIYSISILIYIPINLYRGDFNHLTMTSFVQDILFDGTMYHLWYLPAMAMGLVITYIIVMYVPVKQGIVLCILLYLIALGGDSYYRLLTQQPIIKTIYAGIFSWCEYTRNGIFMAPIFIYIGYMLSHGLLRKSTSMLLFCISFMMMILEAIRIHNNNWFKHDSMYVFLPIVMYALVSWLLHYKGERNLMVKDVSLYMYILHPLVIVLLHIISQILHIQQIIFDQALIQYVFVVLITGGISYGLYDLQNRRKKQCQKRIPG